MQCFLGDPDSGKLHLETHRLALVIAKKTLDENRFTATQKTTSRNTPVFQVGDCVYFKNKEPGKWDLKWRPGYRIVCIECNRHYIHIETRLQGKTQSCNITDIILEPPVKFWNVNSQFGRASCYINHPAIYPQYNLLMHLNNITITFHTLHTTVSSITYHLHTALVLTFILTTNSSQMDPGEWVIFSTSFTSISHQALMDHHSTHITWQIWNDTGTFQWATNQHTTIPQVFGPTSFSTNTTTHYTLIRIIQHTGHIPIQ